MTAGKPVAPERLPLTICSVSFNSRPWLELNRDLARHLNPGLEFSWVVAENSPSHSQLRLASNDPGFVVIAGAEFEQRAYASGSYHHGRGMNFTLRHVTTRYALFSDPDFFVIRPGWMNALMEHMRLHRLAVLGVPWHPRWAYKHRYFPCVHCMLVDLEQVPVAWLDFQPDYERVPPHARQPEPTDRLPRTRRFWRPKLPDPFRFRKRRHIGQSRDVSWRIAQRVGAQPGTRVECLQPVFRPERQGLSQAVERFLPDRWCLVPKRPGYFTERRFKDYGLPDLDARGWEEFLWQGEPFGFHVRSQPKVKERQSLKSHLAEVTEVLGRLSAGR